MVKKNFSEVKYLTCLFLKQHLLCAIIYFFADHHGALCLQRIILRELYFLFIFLIHRRSCVERQLRNKFGPGNS